MDSGAKIRIKVGSMEVEYEGEPSFLKDGLESLLAKMADLSIQVPEEPETRGDTSDGPDIAIPSNNYNLSTKTIAEHLAAKTGPEVVICALAKLQFVDNKDSASRSDILKEMKSAKGIYTNSMGSNLSATLSRLGSNKSGNKRIIQGANGEYSLSRDERETIEAKLADIR